MSRKRNQQSSKESAPRAELGLLSPRCIFISYAHGDPDQALARELKDSLVRAGHQVFIDIDIKVGADWGTTILDWIAVSDFFLLLLSARSVHSEMVREEARVAHGRRAAEGSPRLLPVRVAYTGPLGYALGAWVNPYQWTSWETENDTGRVLQQILDVLEERAEAPMPGAPSLVGPLPPGDFRRPEPMADLSQLDRPGGGLRPDDPFYIERPADREVLDIARHLLEETVVIKGPRQVGKSSLLVRYLAECHQAGKKTALIDMSQFETKELADYSKFLTSLAMELLDEFELGARPRSPAPSR
jgi:TIR domain/AAA-like domain